jgi:hypothetical protein
MQQMSISFVIAVASLATAYFIPERVRSDPRALMAGIHRAFLCLGVLTIVSTLVFRSLRPDDGEKVSRQPD